MGQGKKTNNWALLKKKLPVKQDKNNKDNVKTNSSLIPSISSSLLKNNKKEDFKRGKNGIISDISSAANTDAPVTFESLHCSNKTIDMKMRRLAIALDCEMVGVGTNGKHSALARCSMVDYDGKVLYDKFVQPKGFVTDFRTKYSGIRKQDINKSKAIPLEQCQKEVAALLKGKILVGHALKNDLTALLLSHPKSKIRDTSRYQPYMRQNPHSLKYKPRALKELTKQHLKLTIQTGEHDSVEDARCTMMLFRLAVEEWENSYLSKQQEAKQRALEKAQGITKKSKKQERLEAAKAAASTAKEEEEKKTKPVANVLDSGSEDEDSEIEEIDDGIKSSDDESDDDMDESEDDYGSDSD